MHRGRKMECWHSCLYSWVCGSPVTGRVMSWFAWDFAGLNTVHSRAWKSLSPDSMGGWLTLLGSVHPGIWEDATTLLEGQREAFDSWTHLYPPHGGISDIWACSCHHSHTFWGGLATCGIGSIGDCHHLTRTGNSEIKHLPPALGPRSCIYTFTHVCIP